LGFNILNRESAKKHGLLFSLASILILIPSREANITYALIFTALTFNYIYSIKDTKSLTFEAKISTLIVFLPAALMLGRLAYYPIDNLFLIITSSSCAVSSFYFQRKINSRSYFEAGLSILGWSSLLLLSVTIIDQFNFPKSYFIGFVFGTLMLIFSFYSKWYGKPMRIFATTVIVISLFPGFILGSLEQDLILTLFPLLCLVSSLKTKEKTSFILSSTTLTFSIILLASQVLTVPNLGAWQTLIISGITLILAAGLYDSKKTIIRNYYIELRSNLK